MDRPIKYPSTPHWPESEKVHRDDTYHLDPEFFVGRDVVITEKLDGGNTCLHRGEVYARSVTSPSHDGWMAMVRKHHGWKTNDRSIFSFYGEDLYGIHSIEYDPLWEEDTYRLFAIRDAQGRFLDWDAVVALAIQYTFLTVPVCFLGAFQSMGDITEWFKDNRPSASSLGPEREGFVMRTVDGFDGADFPTHVCKYVRKNHVQTDQHWRVNWKPCQLKRGK